VHLKNILDGDLNGKAVSGLAGFFLAVIWFGIYY
jgi:hypothetical protein